MPVQLQQAKQEPGTDAIRGLAVHKEIHKCLLKTRHGAVTCAEIVGKCGIWTEEKSKRTEPAKKVQRAKLNVLSK